jgi:WD40 repeat protein
MNRLRTIIVLIMVFIPLLLTGATVRLNQKEGKWQSQEGKQVQFKNYKRIEFDFDKVPLKSVQKIILHDGKIFILDFKRCELYVLDLSGKHLYTVGRPGQGPGDIEAGEDFCIDNNKIYVLNAMSNRISVFKINGEPVEIIKLQSHGGFVSSCSIAIDKNQDLLIGSSFNRLLALYNPRGIMKKKVLSRNMLEAHNATPHQIGIPSSLKVTDDSIFHLDIYKGVITKMDLNGNIQSVFSAYLKYPQELIERTEKNSKNDDGRLMFNNWDHLSIDESGKIYTMCKIRKKGTPRLITVFSSDGEYLYSKPLDFLMSAWNFTVGKEGILVLTYDFDLFLVN